MKKENLSVGQKVLVLSVNQRGSGPEEGEVTKIGRKIVTIKTGDSWYQQKQYRIDEQVINDEYGHSFFRTLEQNAAVEQKTADVATLDLYGFRLGFPTSYTAEDLHAVAELLRERHR